MLGCGAKWTPSASTWRFLLHGAMADPASIARGVRRWSQTETIRAAWFVERRPAADYCRAAGPQDGLQDEAGRSAALAGLQHDHEWQQNGQYRRNRTEGHTEQTLGQSYAQVLVASCRLLVLCLATSLPTKNNSGSGSTWDEKEKKNDRGYKCTRSCLPGTWLPGSVVHQAGRRFTHDGRTHRALPAKQRTLQDGRTDKIMAAGKGGFCGSY